MLYFPCSEEGQRRGEAAGSVFLHFLSLLNLHPDLLRVAQERIWKLSDLIIVRADLCVHRVDNG